MSCTGPRPGPRAEPDEMLTIAPDPRGIMSARTARASTIGACTLIANERSHWSTGNSATGANHVHAALLTRMSIGPNAARASSTTRAHASRSRRSATSGTASPPSAWMAATVACNEPATRLSPSLRVRATHATRAPSAARPRAIASPMPRLAPVTIATLPCSRSVMTGPWVASRCIRRGNLYLRILNVGLRGSCSTHFELLGDLLRHQAGVPAPGDHLRERQRLLSRCGLDDRAHTLAALAIDEADHGAVADLGVRVEDVLDFFRR